MFYAGRSPFRISSKDQLRVGNGRKDAVARTIQFRQQLCAVVEPCVRRDPKAALETGGLPLTKGLARGPQHRMAQANRSIHPDFAGVRTAERKKIHERLQQPPIYGRTVPVKNADNSAQSITLLSGGLAWNSRVWRAI